MYCTRACDRLASTTPGATPPQAELPGTATAGTRPCIIKYHQRLRIEHSILVRRTGSRGVVQHGFCLGKSSAIAKCFLGKRGITKHERNEASRCRLSLTRVFLPQRGCCLCLYTPDLGQLQRFPMDVFSRILFRTDFCT